MKLFVSYRRKSWSFTKNLADDLNELIDGEVFVDFKSIDETDFEKSILKHLHDSDVVIVVISEYTFAPDRIHKSDDWVRREILMALEQNKPIILVDVDGKNLPSPIDLPEDIRSITRRQKVDFYHDYWEPAVQKLANFISIITPVEVLPSSGSLSKRSISMKPTFKDVTKLLNERDYAKAIFVLEALVADGFTSKTFDIQEVLEDARLHHNQELWRREAQNEYELIASLAFSSITLRQARNAWANFKAQYPEYKEDPEKLGERFSDVVPSVAATSYSKSEQIQTDENLAERHIQRREFWTQFREKSLSRTKLFVNRTPTMEHWFNIGAGKTGLEISCLLWQEGVGLELYIDVGDQGRNKEIFDTFYAQKDIIEAEFGRELSWRRLDDKRASRIAYKFDEPGGLYHPESWDTLQNLLLDGVMRFDNVFRPRIMKL